MAIHSYLSKGAAYHIEVGVKREASAFDPARRDRPGRTVDGWCPVPGVSGYRWTPLGLLKRGPFEPERESDEQPEQEGDVDEKPEKAILCGKCNHTVTSERQRIEVDGAHRHRFMNPHGFLFDIGCFGEASGCLVIGEPSTEFSWFPGFAWRYAVCSACHEHLGWTFEGPGETRFHGLVLNRLVEGDDT